MLANHALQFQEPQLNRKFDNTDVYANLWHKEKQRHTFRIQKCPLKKIITVPGYLTFFW